MQIAEVINRAAIDLEMGAPDKAAVIAHLADLLVKDGAVTSKADFIADVYAREAEGKTGIGEGVAIPHGKSAAVARTCVAIGRVRNPVAWETLDGQPVKLIIMFAVGVADKNDTFVRLMAQVARKIADEQVCQDLMTAKQPDDVIEIFAR